MCLDLSKMCPHNKCRSDLAADQVEEGLEEFTPTERLEEVGINKGDLKKLMDSGYYTVESILMSTRKALCEVKGLSDAKIEKVIEGAKKLAPATGTFSTAKEYAMIRQRDIVHISTGCQAFDELLGGGVETKAITEVFGEWRTGKTQICHTLCVTAMINEQRAGKVVFIDAEGTFRPERIKPIAERFNIDEDVVLDNIVFARVHTFEQQLDCLVEVAAKMSEEPYKLLVMDSITANMRADFVGRGELAERQQKLGQLMSRLRKLAEAFNVAVVITNQVVSDPSGGMTFVADPKKPVGGHVMAHASTVRLSLRKGKGESRCVKVVQSPNLPEAEATFAISADGVTDYKD